MPLQEQGVRLSVEGERQFLSAMQKAQGSVDGFSQKAMHGDKATKGLTASSMALATAMGQALYAGAMAAGRAISGLVSAGLDSYAKFEQLGMALTTLTARELINAGATDNMADALAMAAPKAKELQDWVTKLAIQSPFTSEGVGQAFKTAMAYGFTTDEAKRLTEAQINFAAGAGLGEEAMSRIALALGQIKAKGKLAGQETLQLTETGLPVMQILAKAFGKTTAEIAKMSEDGLIPADAAIEAITASLENDFSGAAVRSANTFTGLLSSMTDIKQVGLRTFFEGTFKAIQPLLIDFVNLMTDPKTMKSIAGWGESLGNFVNKIAEMGRIGGDIIGKLFSGDTKGAIRGFIEAFDLGKLFNTGILDSVGNIDWAAIISVVVNHLITGMITKQAMFLQIGLDVLNNIASGILTALPTLLTIVLTIVDSIITLITVNLPSILAVGIEIIFTLLDAIVSAIPTLLKAAVKIIPMLIQGIVDTVPKLIDAAVKLIPVIVTTLLDSLPLLITAALEIITALINGLTTAIPQLISMVPTIITAIFDTLIIALPLIGKAAVQIITTLVASLAKMEPQLKKDAGRILVSIVDGIKALIPTVLNVGKDIVIGLWEGIFSKGNWLVDNVKNFFKNIITGVKKVFDEKSPSKVFFEIGMNTVKGFSAGTNDMLKSASPSKIFEEVGANMMYGTQRGILSAFSGPAQAMTLAAKSMVGAVSPAPIQNFGGQFNVPSPVNVNVNANVSNEIDYYKLARRVADEIRLAR